MIKNILIRNFRSIEKEEIKFAPITVLYGPTASGKSSLLYSILVLRNFILNPNRPSDGYFHLGFMDLGGFDACVFNHNASQEIGVTLALERNGFGSSYGLSFSKNAGSVQLKNKIFNLQAKIPIPYGLNQAFSFPHSEGEEEYTINWNGISCTGVSPKKPTTETQQKAREIASTLNIASEILNKEIDIAPLKRGFFKPTYSPVTVSANPTTEAEVASVIINDPHMAGRISSYTGEIFSRDFRIHALPGTATYFFQTTEKNARVPGHLVNDGFGINQVIYMLAKMLRVDVRTVLIEEPEVHLHPTIQKSFARALCTYIKEEGEQVILATHSELFLSSLLAAVADGHIRADQIKCYLSSKVKRTTSFKEQKVQETGQIEGGLSTFIEAEFEDLRKFLGVK